MRLTKPKNIGYIREQQTDCVLTIKNSRPAGEQKSNIYVISNTPTS